VEVGALLYAVRPAVGSGGGGGVVCPLADIGGVAVPESSRVVMGADVGARPRGGGGRPLWEGGRVLAGLAFEGPTGGYSVEPVLAVPPTGAGGSGGGGLGRVGVELDGPIPRGGGAVGRLPA